MRGKIRHPVWKIGLLAAFLAGGCSDPTDTVPKEEADIIVATVGDREITLKDVADQVRASEGALSPGAVLDQLIRRHALIDSALAAGLGESEDVVAAWENALIRELRRTQLDPRLATADPEERDLRSLYERDYRRFQQPERRRLAVVLLADQDAAEAFLAKWKEKADRPVESGFGQFAFEHSLHDRSRYRGGRLGWLEAGARPPDVPGVLIEKGFLLRSPGEISSPIHAGNAWGLVRLLEIDPASTIGFEEARSTLEKEAEMELRRTMEARFYRRMEERSGVQRQNQERLETLQRNEPLPSFGGESRGIAPQGG